LRSGEAGWRKMTFCFFISQFSRGLDYCSCEERMQAMFRSNIKRKIQAAIILLAIPVITYASVFGPDFGYTGAPGDNGNCTACHTGTPNSGGGSVNVTGIPNAYQPGQQYNVTVTVQQTARTRFGFQLTAIDSNGNRAGTLESLGGDTSLNPVSGQGGRQYIQHTQQGTSQNVNNGRSWQVRWTAPATGIGQVRFFVAGNAANNNGNETGDSIYTNSFLSDPNAATPVSVSLVSQLDGQTLSIGSVYRINWSVTGVSNIELIEVRFSTDDGATFPFENRILSTQDTSITSFDWTVPNTPTTQARLRVQVSTRQATALESKSGRFTIQSGGPITNGPVITHAFLKGPKLMIEGSHFQDGAIVEMNGADQKTVNLDPPDQALRCKKAGNKIAVGATVNLVVRNPDGTRSGGFMFTRLE
jgi:hypothetical protein